LQITAFTPKNDFVTSKVASKKIKIFGKPLLMFEKNYFELKAFNKSVYEVLQG